MTCARKGLPWKERICYTLSHTDRNGPRRPLTELQQAILDFLWTRGPATADQVREALRQRHPLKDSSVRTLLRRLEARGLLTHRTEGKVFVYRAVVPPRSLAARAVRQIIDRFWSGSVEQFVVGMVDEKVLSAAELDRLARKVRRRK
jgi:BlaI family transcriptional regulator, penicillinase repressor